MDSNPTESIRMQNVLRLMNNQATDQARNKFIIQHPEVVRQMSLDQLYREKERVDREIQRLTEMKNSRKDQIWENREIQKDLDEKAAYDLKGWDRVVLNEGEVKTINDLVLDQMGTDGWLLKHVAVRRLAVTFKDEIYYFTALSANRLHVRIWENAPECQTFSAEYDIKIYPKRFEFMDSCHLTEDMKEFLTQCSDGSGIRNFETTALMYIMLNTFFLHYRDIAFNVKEIQCKGPSKKVNYQKSTVETRVVRLVKQYTLKKNWISRVEKRKAEIRCQAWGVRGHFRHYRDGKVIFIEAYAKGKNRAAYQGKVYELLPKTNEKENSAYV